ncbi:hybrid sensor histidine kinase/response regulator [Methylobacterium aerolatum]|uniref:histidine kinase n=1 Tax=Methylobacterium aerolatum TaxID=418708 RepID=A0ABU0I5I8_9HYPH|nr:ATP-binding protein [Methylobacterium aerolatum]MDQ0449882.1 signal transduction histidine kinase/DNA-binding response OmpR family regulator/HPt (histidine-containing phosphotransfer) domain-containing protein [Methylobacterium aerolatum]GJD37203.1 Sensor histidine kinase RcsC [Methylobacterium aerolatum]
MDRRLILISIAIIVLYLLSSTAVSVFHDRAGAAVASWCATCLYLAALVRSRRIDWLPLTIAAILSNLGANLLNGTELIAATSTVFTDAFEILIAAVALQQLNLDGHWYESAAKTICIPLIAATSSILGMGLEAAVSRTFDYLSFYKIFAARQSADFMSLLIMVTVVQTWTDPLLLRGLTPGKIFEIVLLASGVAVLGIVLFTLQTPFVFILIPLLLLGSFRGGMLASAACVTTLFLIANYVGLEDFEHNTNLHNISKYNILLTHYVFILVALLSTLPSSVLLKRLDQSKEQLQAAGVAAEIARRDAELARDKAETASRVKADFLSAISHELRTPLTTVLGLVDLLSREDLDARQKYYVSNINKSGSHLLNIINDFLDISKIDYKSVTLVNEQFPIRPLVNEVCDGFAALLAAKEIDFIVNFDDDMPTSFTADPGKIRQILLNLVGNAAKFTSEGFVSVSIIYRPRGTDTASLRFEVRDSGIGIAKAHQSLIFDAFTQENRWTGRHFGGSGLGLAICKRLVLAMGGDIDVESAPEVGSLFWFEVPVFEPAADYNYDRSEASKKPAERYRILVAEDVAINRSIIGVNLTDMGHTVTLVADGFEALERVEREPYDLILMDIQMPVVDGVEATRRIRQLQSPRNQIPIIALSAAIDSHQRDEFLAAGMNECLSKPIEWPQLSEAIQLHAAGGERLWRLPQSDVSSPINVTPGTWSSTPQSHLDGSEKREPPVLDRGKLDQLHRKMGADIEPLLNQALAHASDTLQKLSRGNLSKEDILREAHRMKGMAGMLGLDHLRNWAIDIEARIDSQIMEAGSLDQLCSALEESRLAVDNLNFGAASLEVR